MYYSIEGFETLIDQNFPDNTNQEILAAQVTEVSNAFIDSFAHVSNPVTFYPFKLIFSDLDVNLSVVLPHGLNTTSYKIILFNREKIRVSGRYFDASTVNVNSILLRIFAGIPGNEVYSGLIYKI